MRTGHPRKKKSEINTSDQWAFLRKNKEPWAQLYESAPMERIKLVKAGAPAILVTYLVDDMAITKELLYKTIGLPRATIDRKVRVGARLTPNESERIIGIAQLVGQVEQMIAESGDHNKFDAGKWVAAWLATPLPALGGRCPGTLMDTAEGRALVADLVSRMQSGAYS
jgi:putative toxin-antitoxin system antitoxin component (TIGR02293 family)